MKPADLEKAFRHEATLLALLRQIAGSGSINALIALIAYLTELLGSDHSLVKKAVGELDKLVATKGGVSKMTTNLERAVTPTPRSAPKG